MAEWRSQYCSTNNEYILYRIWVRETAIDTIANTSTIRITVYAWRTNNYRTDYEGRCNVKIDGVARSWQTWGWQEKPVYQDSDTVLYDEENIVIQHEPNGAKSINVQATCEWYNGGSSPYIDSPYQGWDIALTAIDRAPANVSATVTNVGVNSITINGFSDVNCDLWYYSLDNGANYVWYSSSNATSTSVVVNGLSPNTTYNVKISARKTSNQVWKDSEAVTITTIGNSILNSVNTFTADESSDAIVINATVYVPSYSHTLEIRDGRVLVLTKTGISLQNGINVIYLSSSERNTILNYMSSITSFTGTFYLSTWSGSTQIGVTSSKNAIIQTTPGNSSPIFSGFIYRDINSATISVTGNDQILIQDWSNLQVIANAATARNGSSIKSYSLIIGGISLTSPSTTITVGAIHNTGSINLTVSVIDSRGYSASISTNVTVVPYSRIQFVSESIRRVNEIENTIQLAFEGVMSNIIVSGSNKNSLQVCKYRYKKTSDANYSNYVDITNSVNVSGTRLTYSNYALISLDSNYSWHLEIYLQDKLLSNTIVLTIGPGTPLASFRTRKIGINQKNPSEALDVIGNAKISGSINSQNFYTNYNYSGDCNNITGPFNIVSGSGLSNAPSSGWCVIINVSQNANPVYCNQLAFAIGSNTMYVRNKSGGAWSAWRSI